MAPPGNSCQWIHQKDDDPQDCRDTWSVPTRPSNNRTCPRATPVLMNAADSTVVNGSGHRLGRHACMPSMIHCVAVMGYVLSDSICFTRRKQSHPITFKKIKTCLLPLVSVVRHSIYEWKEQRSSEWRS